MNQEKQQKLVNDAIDMVNAIHRATGKGEVSHLEGVQGCPTNCAIARTLKIRNKTHGRTLYVRSKKQAQAISAALGTTFSEIPKSERTSRGYKDFKAEVRLPRAATKFIEAFDDDRLQDVQTHIGYVRNRISDTAQKVFRLEKGEPVKLVSGATVTVDEAISIVEAFRRN